MKLKNLHTNQEMKTPDGYFEKSYEQLTDEFALRSILSEKEDFSLPDNYFEASQKRILTQIAEPKSVRILPIWRYAVASVAVILITISAYISLQMPSHNSLTISDLSSTEIQNYIDESAWSDDLLWLSEQVPNDVNPNEYAINQTEIEQYLNEYSYMEDIDY